MTTNQANASIRARYEALGEAVLKRPKLGGSLGAADVAMATFIRSIGTPKEDVLFGAAVQAVTDDTGSK
jgi:hypothetical protein